jgi:acyl-CoA thioester hydrolase
MTPYVVPIQLRWTDIDANRHVKHSSYYDFGAIARMNFFVAHGLSIEKMREFSIGPVLFREEAVFKREIRYEDKVTIDVRIVKASPDYSRWSLQHKIYLDGNTVAAIITG